MKLIMCLALLLSISMSVDDGDWVDPFRLSLQFSVHPFFAGYLNISTTKAFYYVFQHSENNPAKDPLVVLLSSGPGCSSLYTWLYSKGEFVFVRNTTEFRHNIFGWNQKANILYIEGPAGVGFSFGQDTNQTDDSLQRDYFRAIMRFYQKFPQLKDQPMYLSGSHYAGVTAPRVALNIIEHNANPDTPQWLHIRLAGLFLYNPCTMGNECSSAQFASDFNSYTVLALRNNYFLSKQQYDEYYINCGMNTAKCRQIKQRIYTTFRETGADLHNLYKQCLNQPGDYGCLDHIGIDAFLNSPPIKEDLNADTNIKWQLCNSSVMTNFKRDGEGSLEIYETLLREEHNLKIWIVSGTMSALVPTVGTRRWIEYLKSNMGLATLDFWKPWFWKNVNAGDKEDIRGLSLITIRSAGFYMFQDQPELANYVFNTFITNGTLTTSTQ